MSDKLHSYRPSSYNIIVPLERDSSKYMLVHGYTGAIDIASSNVVGLLKSKGSITKDIAIVSAETFDMLVARGYLTEKTREEEYAYCKRWANFMHVWKKKVFTPDFHADGDIRLQFQMSLLL